MSSENNTITETIESSYQEPKNEEEVEGPRGGFGNAFEYFLANLGMTVGLGNIWR